jgi:hypothetical protein
MSGSPGRDETIESKPQPCTKRGAPTILARIEPARPGFDLRTFECSKCNNADQYIIEYGTAMPRCTFGRRADATLDFTPLGPIEF